MVDLFELAQSKVQDSEVLAQYEDFILTDWPEGDEHWQWVLDASEAEIVDWVEAGQ